MLDDHPRAMKYATISMVFFVREMGYVAGFCDHEYSLIWLIMDCGDLEVLYGAASEEGYKKLMEVMEGIGEPL